MKSVRWQGLWLLLTAVLVVSAPTLAQTQATGVIEGRVVDSAGEAVPGATVNVALADGSYPKGAVTDGRGSFRIPFLPPGSYDMVVRASGFATRTFEALRVSAASVQRLDVAILGEITEEITVSAAAPQIDTVSTEDSLIMGAREIQQIPIGRNTNELAKFTPGAASSSRIWGGVNGQANAFQLDGVSVNQPGFGGSFLIPNIDWVEEFQVRGLGAGAEYGNFQGGLLNIVTKSGSNTFEANVRANYSSADLNATNVNAAEDGEEQDLRWEFNADVSGPLIRNKLWYFFSVQNVQIDTRVVDASSDDLAFLGIKEERTEQKLYGKITWQASDRDSFNFVLGWDGVDVENRGIGTFVAPEATVEQDSPSYFYNASWQHIFSDRLFLEAKINGYSGEDDRSPKNGDLPSVQILGGDRNLFRNAVFTRQQEPESLGTSVALDWFLETGRVNHHVKAGAELVQGSWLETRTRHANLTWRPEEGAGPFDPEDPATWGFISSDWGGNIRLDAETDNGALYVQDYMKINEHLSVNAGLRYGTWEGSLTPGFGGGATIDAIDDQAFDPRLGVVYDFGGDGRWVAKAHWGRYHQSLFALMFDRVEGGNVFTNEEYWDWLPLDASLPDIDRNYTNPGGDPDTWVFFGDNPLGDEVGPVVDYDQPYVDQLVLSLEHAFNPRFKMGLVYVERENKDIVSLVDRNLASNYTVYENVTVDVDGYGTITLPELYISNLDIIIEGAAPGLTPADIAALDYDQQLVLTNPEGATRKLEQYQLTGDYYGRDWSLNASVVYSDLTGNYNSVSGYSNPAGTLGAGGFVRPNEQVNWDGRLPNQPRWEIKARFSYDLPYDVRVGAYLRHFSGDFFTRGYEIDRRRDTFFTEDGTEFTNSFLLFEVNGQTAFVDGRGSRRYDASTLLDLRVEKAFRFGDLEWIVAADIFNLTNEDAVTGVDEEVNFGTFGTIRSRTPSRALRLSTSLHW